MYRSICHRNRSRTHDSRGFTLIEALVVIALTAILAGLAAPSFTSLFQRYRVDSVREEMVGSMNLAKTEAIRLGQTITIQKLSPGGGCATAGDWSCGWQVQNAAGTVIQEVNVPSQTSVLKSGGLNSFSINQYGQVVGGHNILIYPSTLSSATASPAHSLMCFAAGSRVRTIKNAIPPCP
jgi:type IV fimbrial biogenesis protein FimT